MKPIKVKDDYGRKLSVHVSQNTEQVYIRVELSPGNSCRDYFSPATGRDLGAALLKLADEADR